MATTVTVYDKEVRKALDGAKKFITDPKKALNGIGLVLIQGFEQQFDTQGRHWSSPWPRASAIMIAVRRWQGRFPNYVPLNATGASRRSFVVVPKNGSYGNGIIVGSTMKHLESLHLGKVPQPQPAKFRGPGGKTWRHSFKKVRKFRILPQRLTAGENRAIVHILDSEVQAAMRNGA